MTRLVSRYANLTPKDLREGDLILFKDPHNYSVFGEARVVVVNEYEGRIFEGITTMDRVRLADGTIIRKLGRASATEFAINYFTERLFNTSWKFEPRGNTVVATSDHMKGVSLTFENVHGLISRTNIPCTIEVGGLRETLSFASRDDLSKILDTAHHLHRLAGKTTADDVSDLESYAAILASLGERVKKAKKVRDKIIAPSTPASRARSTVKRFIDDGNAATPPLIELEKSSAIVSAFAIDAKEVYERLEAIERTAWQFTSLASGPRLPSHQSDYRPFLLRALEDFVNLERVFDTALAKIKAQIRKLQTSKFAAYDYDRSRFVRRDFAAYH